MGEEESEKKIRTKKIVNCIKQTKIRKETGFLRIETYIKTFKKIKNI